MEQTTKTYKVYAIPNSLLWGVHRAILRAKCKELIDRNKLIEVGKADYIHAEQLNTAQPSLVAIHFCCQPRMGFEPAIAIEDEKRYLIILNFNITEKSVDNGAGGGMFIVGTAKASVGNLKAIVIRKDEEQVLDMKEFARSAHNAVDNLVLAIKTQPNARVADETLAILDSLQDNYIRSIEEINAL